MQVIERDGKTDSDQSSTYMTAPKPVYSSPAKYFRAAEAVAAELPRLTGEMLTRQQARVQELLAAGRQMNIDIAKTRQGQGASQVIYSARAASKSLRQASSPHLGMPREKSVNSAQQKEMQIQAYDPIVAGKRAVYYVEDQRIEILQPNQAARHHHQ